MKRVGKEILAFIFAVCIILFYPYVSHADTIRVPEKVKIGLYYGSTAVPSFTANAEKGLELGIVKEEDFDVLYKETKGNTITIKKDTDYHIQIGGNYKSLNDADDQITSLKKKGVSAYVVYVDTWQVWSGAYKDKDSAQADIKDVMEKKAGKGTYKVVQPLPKGIAAINDKGDIVTVFASDTAAFQIHPDEDNKPYAFQINNLNKYRGDLEIKRFSDSDMTVINVLPLEQYLYGVVPNELEASAPLEALKAQAVAARTYTLNNLGKFGKWSFDLCPTTYDQVYKGLNFEQPSTNQAVDETEGEKITYKGELAEVFYFASSGGKTEDSKNVFEGDYPYLKSVDDEYESGKSWHYTWEVTLTAQRIKEVLSAYGYDVGEIVSVEITKTSDAGRVTELTIKGTKGQPAVFTKNRCRTIFGLDSQWYTISGTNSAGSGSSDGNVNVKLKDSVLANTKIQGKKLITTNGVRTIVGDITMVDANGRKKTITSTVSRSSSSSATATPGVFKISGRGWGHGVGMSQEGAKGMAKAGYDYEEILTHYFQGTKVE